MSAKPPVGELIEALAARLGVPRFVAVCTDLMAGADREEYVEELRGLIGHDWREGDGVLDQSSWPDYWPRTWGARGLLHVWDDGATDAVVAGLRDEHWRPAEMCLKVAAAHEVAGAGDGAAALADHPRSRVRVQAMRALAVVGNREHVDVVRRHLDDDATRAPSGGPGAGRARRPPRPLPRPLTPPTGRSTTCRRSARPARPPAARPQPGRRGPRR